MNTRYIKISIFTLGIIGISIFQIHGNSSGASSPLTGAPNENTCTSCHSGSSLVTSGNQHDRIRLTGNFTGNGYIPDSIYNLTLTYAESGKSTFGFQMTALTNGNAAGRFTASSRTTTFSSNVNGSTRYYIEHNSSGSSSVATDSTAWTFQWRAPNSNVGEVTFYVALNSTNSNGSSSGDVIYNKTFKINPSSLLPKATAKLTSSLACAGSRLNLEGSSTNSATSYEWIFPNGSPSTSTAQNPEVTYAASGNQIALLRSFNAKGASLFDTLKMTILDAAVKPNMNIRTATTVLCLGDSIEFSVGSLVRHTYTWPNGATGRSTKIDSGGWVFATANRDNGCIAVSDSVFVVAFPKPTFNIGYGIYTDSVCTKEPLLVLLNNKAFADSYSSVGPTGPFSTDSFLIKTIQNGPNNFQFWAKSKIGCVSPASDLTTFVGIDTPDAPQLKIAEVLIDKIKFEWSSSPFAESYLYSIDLGKNWNSPSSMDSNFQWIELDSATQTVHFWIKAKTGVFCGFSQIDKIQAKGAGCDEPKWNITVNKDSICKDSFVLLRINGLHTLDRYQLWVNETAFNDSIWKETILSNKLYTLKLLDSQQLICGYFEKSIRVFVDIPKVLSSNFTPDQVYTYCGINNRLNLDLSINNSDSRYSYMATTTDSQYMFNPSAILSFGNGVNRVELSGRTPNGCNTENVGFTVIVDTLPNTDFNVTWQSEWIYSIEALNTDTLAYIHVWTINGNDTLMNESNVFSFDYNFNSYQNREIQITHTLKSKNSDYEDTLCVYVKEKTFTIKNLSSEFERLNNSIRFYPNPLGQIKDLKCDQCNENFTFSVYNNTGKLMGSFNLETIKRSQLSAGIYWIEIESSNQKLRHKILVSE